MAVVAAEPGMRPSGRTPLHRGPDTALVVRAGALVATFVAGTGMYATHFVSFADIMAVVLAPVWLTLLRRYHGAVALFAASPLLLVAGLSLASFSRSDHSVSHELAHIQISILMTGFAVLAIVLWARSLLPWWRVAIAFGLGQLADVLGTGTAFGADGFKFHLAVPLTVAVLALTHRFGGFVGSAVTALILGVLGIVNDARSYMAFCVIAAALALWQAARISSRRRMRRLSPLLVLGGLGGGIYLVLSNLLVGGYLGAELQAKSVAQVDAAGSLLAGGRPEWAATFQLMGLEPGGFGLGVRPSWLDIIVAKRGLRGVGLPIENNGYIDNYMFGQGYDMHSIVAELWAAYGWVGLVFAALVVALLLGNLARMLAERTAGTLLVFVSISALWNLGFGPLYTNWSDVCVALGLLLAVRSTRGTDVDAAAVVAPGVPETPSRQAADQAASRTIGTTTDTGLDARPARSALDRTGHCHVSR